MKIIRLSLLLMLILTLTPVIASCDVSLPDEVENQIDNSFDKLEDRIENEPDYAQPNTPKHLLREESVRETEKTEPPAREESVRETEKTEPPAREESVREAERTEPPARETQSGKPNRKTDKEFVGEVALTFEDAESIALEHAGVKPADALYLRTELERDDGIPVYEVEFYVDLADRAEHLEYEYTVHADTGKILEFEVDRD